MTLYLDFSYTPFLMDDPSSLHQQAISAALSSNWEEALRLNQQIIDLDPKNVEALNRTGRAYFELGNLSKSRKCFEDALIHDAYNQIAAKFLKRIKAFKKGVKVVDIPKQSYTQVDSDFFIEEPGKTRLITLLKVAEPQKLSLLSAGTLVNLVIKNHSVAVSDQRGEYLGVLPDDMSHHLIRLINGGNKFQALIKTVKTNSLTILVKEIFRAPRFRNQASFLEDHGETTNFSSDRFTVSPAEMEGEIFTMETDEEETS